MCGISGIVIKQAKSNMMSYLYTMNDIQKHRGSDDEGYALFNSENAYELGGDRTPQEVYAYYQNLQHKKLFQNIESTYVGLSHNRLSIIDLSPKGHQPFKDISENYFITYNGEIYNYKQLKDELQGLGFSFKTTTDTEVLLNAYIAWGEDCVKRFNGMWAFCVYDKKKNILFLSRDRFGVKPLYYLHDSNAFAFASELKALYHFPERENELSSEAVFNYLSMGVIENEENGFVKNIFELKPSENLIYNLDNYSITKQKYYTLSTITKWQKTNPKKEKEHIEKLEYLIENSIKFHLQSDVSVGTCLSGGIDSSIIVSVINKLKNSGDANAVGTTQKTFTSCFKNSLIDEEAWAKIVAEANHTEWYKTYPTSNDFINDIEDLVYFQDVPFLNSSTYAQYRVMKLASENGIKVTLDGQGADELFAGYDDYYSSFLINSLSNLDVALFRNNASSKYLSRPIKFIASELIPQSLTSVIYKKSAVEFNLINKNLWENYSNNISLINNTFNHNLNSFLLNDFTSQKFKTLLRTADRNSMRFSIESRVPFADDIDLVEYCFSIPAPYKIKNKFNKYLLREASKNVLPKAIYERKDKIGFATPENNWFKKEQNSLLDLIPYRDDEYVNWSILRKNWPKYIDHANKTSTRKLWRFINFSVWRKVHKL